MGLELWRLASLAMQSRLSKILGRAAALALSPGHTSPLERQALELHTMRRLQGLPRARGLDCGVPRYMHQSLFFITALIGTEKVQWAAIGSTFFPFPSSISPKGILTSFAVPEKVANTLPYRYQGQIVQH